ncbi:MAG: hypothetical protein V4543_00870 [Bacteroidota bacterium]
MENSDDSNTGKPNFFRNAVKKLEQERMKNPFNPKTEQTVQPVIQSKAALNNNNQQAAMRIIADHAVEAGANLSAHFRKKKEVEPIDRAISGGVVAGFAITLAYLHFTDHKQTRKRKRRKKSY